MKIHTKPLFRRIVVGVEFRLQCLDKAIPQQDLRGSENDSMFRVLRSGRTERRDGEYGEVIAIEGEVDCRGHGGESRNVTLTAEVSYISLDSPVEIETMAVERSRDREWCEDRADERMKGVMDGWMEGVEARMVGRW